MDRRGRRRSCRHPGAVLRWRRRRCQVRVAACYWLHQPDETLLLDLVARELNQQPTPSAGEEQLPNRVGSSEAAPVTDPETNEVLEGIEPEQDGLRIRPPQLLAVLGGDCPEAGGLVRDHGFDRLVGTGLTALLDPDHPGGLHRVVITSLGRVRYQELSAMRNPAADPDQPPGEGMVFADRPPLRSRPVRAAGEGAVR
ncbi:MAG: hypothetical protein ACRDTC_06995 [Pseudonocardiaceae bacterium]